MNTFSPEAYFCDFTEEYITPLYAKQNDQVSFLFRTGKGEAVSVKMIAAESSDLADAETLLLGTKGALRWEVDCKKVPPFENQKGKESFDYYEAKVRVGSRPLCYYFEIETMEECDEEQVSVLHTYCAAGLDHETPWTSSFCLIPDERTPKWMNGAVMYQIFVDRFYNGDPSNDVENDEYLYLGKPVKCVPWDAMPEKLDVGRFHGGDLAGVREKFGYLKELGVEVLYLNPIFLSPSNHKYDTQDYRMIDPHFTVNLHIDYHDEKAVERQRKESETFFASFMEEAHRQGFRVILDGVFNHCGSFNCWMDREKIYESKSHPGAYLTKESPYVSYFQFKKDAWPDNDSYDKWWGMDTLPKLAYEHSEKLCEEVLAIGRKWVSEPFLADGWRLDVAADLGKSEEFNHSFWKRFRDAVYEANPEAVVLAEHYESPRSWISDREWDTVMNYGGFMEPVSFYFTGVDKHSDSIDAAAIGQTERFWEKMLAEKAQYPGRSYAVSMNELSNHDHSRFYTRTSGKVGRIANFSSEEASSGIDRRVFGEAILFQMTWRGAPTIYYGDEAGLTGFTDPDNRRTYPWGKEDHDLITLHQKLTQIRKEYPALRTGAPIPLPAVSDQDGDTEGILGFGRFTEESHVVVLINHNEGEMGIQLPVYPVEIPGDATLHAVGLVKDGHFAQTTNEVHVEDGWVHYRLPEKSGVILALEAKV